MITVDLHSVVRVTTERVAFRDSDGPPFDVIYLRAYSERGELEVKLFVAPGAKVGLADEGVSNG
jgi:hypothetical protein